MVHSWSRRSFNPELQARRGASANRQRGYEDEISLSALTVAEDGSALLLYKTAEIGSGVHDLLWVAGK